MADLNNNADELHVFLCNLMGVGYYDKEGFNKKWNNLLEKLNKNGYDIKYSKE